MLISCNEPGSPDASKRLRVFVDDCLKISYFTSFPDFQQFDWFFFVLKPNGLTNVL